MTGASRRSGYERLLRLRHLRLTSWQRVLLADVPLLVVGPLLALTGLAGPEVVVALPLAVAAVVVLHDRVAGLLLEAPGHGRTAPG